MDLIIVGLGWAGVRHAQAVRELEAEGGVRLVAVVDPDRAHREAEVSRLRAAGVMGYDDLGEALASHAGAGVVVATPHGLHAEGVCAAAAAGRAVMVEKPIAPTLDEADAMIAACEQAGVTLMVAESIRYNRVTRKLTKIVASGRVGQPLAARFSFIGRGGQQYGYPGRRAWLGRPDRGGSGIWLLNGIHHVSLARMLLGEVERVTASEVRSASLDAPVEATVMALLQFASGAVAHMTSSAELRGYKRFRDVVVFGSEGTVCTDLREPERIELYRGQAEQPDVIDAAELESPGPADGAVEQAPVHFVRQMREFVNAVAQEREPATSGRGERATLAVIVAGYESMRTGAAVEVR
ncbi:MAG: Gfo/Idh/MocA family oxidoreductase [Phycisphaeraceae bacterium]